ncbi:MAG: hypothetical protein QOF84_2023 [Streptomyces sp.]|nr:hypothetical protein [Streptomyces sp.]
MHAGWRKARTVALAAGVAAALTAGAVSPAGATVDQTTAKDQLSASALKGNAKTWITLITGDRIGVNAKGKPVALKRAKGREGIPVQVQTLDGHTYAIPLDAARLIQKGRVDRRLFDITTLSRAEYRKAQAKSLGYIVTYKGGKPAAKAELHAADGTQVTHTYKRLDGEAVTTPTSDAAAVWKALTNEPANGTPYATAESGLKTVWLDALQKAAADDVSTNMKQINAPTAWAAGYDGTGVKIAILDTGVDKAHEDLAGRVVDEKNFSAANNVDDHFGHGTHVASIAAGTGVKSAGKYKGVASGAQLLNGKVLDDDGYGDDAGIIAGLEWAAASGAKVANLSLGGMDTPGVDPIEEAVNTLSADTGTLFVIAAGNSGSAAGTVGSPGSADAALTVGAVDSTDTLADFSSRGPRIGDGAIKPDVTAPGVDITAAAAPGSVIDGEVGENPPGYLTISGTSMATPHVAGSAALLAQEHPSWTGQQIKAALTGSTTPGAYNPFEQGSGRIDLSKAIKQTVVADPVSLSFGAAAWPHQDDPKVTKTVTYSNTGSEAVTLDLTATATGPKGDAAPDGFFTLSTDKVTVPAGGTASADVTVDTTLGGDVDGAYSAYIVATAADGQTVRTAAAVTREVESYNVTIKHLDRDGNATASYDDTILGLVGDIAGSYYTPYDPSGTSTIRVPKGRYLLSSDVFVGDGTSWQGADWINQPNLTVTGDTTITVDARTAKPIDLTVPDGSAVSQFASPDYSVQVGDTFGADFGWWLDSYKGFRSAHLGPATAAGELHETYAGTWTHGTTEYNLAYGRSKTKLATGFTKHAKAADLAKINVKLGASVKNKTGLLFAMPDTGGNGGSSTAFERKLPRSYKLYVNGGSSVKWSFEFLQLDSSGNFEADYSTANSTLKAGKTYAKTFNVGVFGPKVDSNYGLFRDGNQIFGFVPLLADGSGRVGSTTYDKATTTLYRNGEKVGSNTDPLTGEPFTVKAAKANYKLTTSLTRSGVAGVTTKVTAAWTFSSKKTSGQVKLPASAVKFSPSLTTASTSKAKASVKVPVTVLGSAAGRNLKSLKVYVSFDGGKHWTKLTVKNGKVTVKNPKAGKGVSLKANVTDKKGNTLSQVIYNAYLTK